MARKTKITDLLLSPPWWASLCFAVISYLVLKFAVSSIGVTSPILSKLAVIAPKGALPIAGVFVVAALLSALHALRKGELLDTQTGISSIRDMSWKDFELLVSEAFRREGYQVIENFTGGADGGVDLVLTKEGRRLLVQCKNWKSRSVGVPTVRELFGVISAESADGGFVVTSGNFTKEARAFASGNPIQLIDGAALVQLVGKTQSKKETRVVDVIPSCPRCGETMVSRTASRGTRTGQNFWGCSSFPKCRGVRQA